MAERYTIENIKAMHVRQTHEESRKCYAADQAVSKQQNRIVFDEHALEEHKTWPKGRPYLYIPCRSSSEAKEVAEAVLGLVGIDNKIPMTTSRKGVVIYDEYRREMLKNKKHSYEISRSKDWYTYKKLESLKLPIACVEDTDRTVSRYDGWHFIETYHHREYNSQQMLPEFKTIGKFHLSVAKDDIARAWDAIAPLLISSELDMTLKVICDVNTPIKLASGKDIVLYIGAHNQNDAERWQQLLCEVEQRLEEAHIQHGPEVDGDAKVKGSRGYLYVREGHTDYRNGKVANPYVISETSPPAMRINIDLAAQRAPHTHKTMDKRANSVAPGAAL